MKTIIVGCGNIGIKRINAIQNIPDIDIVQLVEVDTNQLDYLKKKYDYPISKEYKQFLTDDTIDAFIVSATTHPSLQIIEDALKAGKHVLCEKPLGENLSQTEKITNLANKNSLVLHIGFNIRYDEGLLKAKELILNGKIGEHYFFKCTYVNGSVRANNNKVGALLDMGIHNLYLSQMFMGNFRPLAGTLQNFEYYLKDKDDNGFVILKSDSMIGSIHFSLCRWKNEFELEVTGSKGSVIVKSLTKWGTQTTYLHERVYPSGIPNETVFSYSGDYTWEKECREFYSRVINNDLSKNNEAVQIMRIIDIINKISNKNR